MIIQINLFIFNFKGDEIFENVILKYFIIIFLKIDQCLRIVNKLCFFFKKGYLWFEGKKCYYY